MSGALSALASHWEPARGPGEAVRVGMSASLPLRAITPGSARPGSAVSIDMAWLTLMEGSPDAKHCGP